MDIKLIYVGFRDFGYENGIVYEDGTPFKFTDINENLKKGVDITITIRLATVAEYSLAKDAMIKRQKRKAEAIGV